MHLLKTWFYLIYLNKQAYLNVILLYLEQKRLLKCFVFSSLSSSLFIIFLHTLCFLQGKHSMTAPCC